MAHRSGKSWVAESPRVSTASDTTPPVITFTSPTDGQILVAP